MNLSDPRGRGRRARVGARAWGQDRPRAAGPGRRLPGAAVAVPPRLRPVLGGASQEAGIPVMLHASDSGYQRYANEWIGIGAAGEIRPFEPDVFSTCRRTTGRSWTRSPRRSATGCSPASPACASATIENGSTWITRLVEDLLDAYGKMPHEFAEHPLDTLRPPALRGPVLGGAARAAGGRRSGSTTCCSTPTGRTPRAWPTPSSTHFRPTRPASPRRRGQDHGREHVRADGGLTPSHSRIAKGGSPHVGFRHRVSHLSRSGQRAKAGEVAPSGRPAIGTATSSTVGPHSLARSSSAAPSKP